MTIPKFIKVNEVYSDGNKQILIINTAFIMSVKKAKQGDTMINMSGDRNAHTTNPVYFFVKETVEEVEAML